MVHEVMMNDLSFDIGSKRKIIKKDSYFLVLCTSVVIINVRGFYISVRSYYQNVCTKLV